MQDDEFNHLLRRLTPRQRFLVRLYILLRLHYRRLWFLTYPGAILLIAANLNPEHRFIMAMLAALSLVYAQVAVRLHKL